MIDKKVQIGAIAAIVIIALVTAISITIFSDSDASTCKLQHERPPFGASDIENVNCNYAMANFAGFLAYSGKAPKQATGSPSNNTASKMTVSYLPLYLKEVRKHGTLNTTGQRMVRLELSLSCCHIELIIKPKGDNPDKSSLIQVNSMNLTNISSDGDKTSCLVLHPDITFQQDRYYSCKSEKSYSCVASNGTEVAKLVFEQFEFEIDGVKEKMHAKKFSKPPQTCK